jgi:hypothetical protein
MQELKIKRYNKNNVLLKQIGLNIEKGKITYKEIKKRIISKYPNDFKENDRIETNGYCPVLESYIQKNVSLIKFLEKSENEEYNNQNNYNVEINENQKEENEEKSDEESESDDSFLGKTLDEILKKTEEKKLTKKRRREEENNNNNKNIVKFDDNYEIISDFAPTRREILKVLFDNNNNQINYKNNKYQKKYLNPEKYAKVNDIQIPFFNGETLISSLDFPNENNKFENQEFKKEKINEKEEKNYQKKPKKKVEVEKKRENEEEFVKEKEIKIEKKIEKEEEEEEFEFYDIFREVNKEGICKALYKFYSLTYPNFKERIKYSKIINQIRQLELQNKEKKLNFVFDLDSTLICARVLEFYKLNEVKEKYKSLGEYYQFIELYNSAFQIQNLIVNYRSGIKSMFNKIKDISNLYIYTLSFGNYADTIKQYIEQLCKVKFEKIFYFIPNQNEKRMKFFRKLNLSHFNTLILDDLEEAWYDPTIRHKCIINSMSYCCDKTYIIANQTFLENRNKGINPPFFFNINKSQNENWLENLMMIVFRNPFKEISSGRFFHIETEKSNKKQLEYIGNLYVTVYNIMEFMNFKTICAMDAIKMIRITLFAGMIFDISNYYDESFNILRVLIISNGGEIFNGNNYYDDADYVYICNMNIYENNINDIENKKSKYYNFHLINEKYIFECSFCMTKFSLEDPEYILEE